MTRSARLFLTCPLLLLAGMIALTAKAAASQPAEASPAAGVERIGRMDHPPIRESSGVIESRRFPGVFWTHNDSGNPPHIFAVDRTGKLLGEWRIDATNEDWEDIAIDDQGRLYIAETGSTRRNRDEIRVYRITEPDPRTWRPGTVGGPLPVDRTWRLNFPGLPWDCESLFLWQGDGYLISKEFTGRQATIFRFPLEGQAEPFVLERVTSLPIRSPVTGADISRDGSRLAVVSPLGLWVFGIAGDIESAGRTDPLHMRFFHPGVEAVCFVEDGVLTTAESREIFLFTHQRLEQGLHEPMAEPVRLNIRRGQLPPPRVDGEMDGWLNGAYELPLQADHEEDLDAPPTRLWTCWLPEGLYLTLLVHDPDLQPLSRPWFDGDVVEVFFGREFEGRPIDYVRGDDRLYLGFGRAEDGSIGDLQVHWPRREEPPAGVEAAGRVNDDGTYQVELFLPARLLGAFPDTGLQAGTELRLNVSILSRRPPLSWYLSHSNAAGTWLSPATWAIVRLEQ